MKRLTAFAALLICSNTVSASTDTARFPVQSLKSPHSIGVNIDELYKRAGPKKSHEKWTLSLGISKMSGSTQYEIGGTFVENGVSTELYFPVSQLKFPLELYLVAFHSGLQVGNRYTFFLEAAKNITGNRGKMKDLDYLSNGSAFIYSESDTELDARTLDLGTGFKLLNRTSHALTILLGYRLEYFDYEIKNLNQWYPLEPGRPNDRQAGKVLEYEVTYHLPYIGLKLDFLSTKKIECGFFGHIYPFAVAKDTDDHILRKRLSKGSTKGDGYRFGLKLSTKWGNGWFAAFLAERIFVETSGTDVTLIYGGEGQGDMWTIDHRNEIDRTMLSGFIGLHF